MKNTTSLFSLKTYTRNWYVQKWLLVIGFIALFGFNAQWIAENVLPKASNKTTVKDKPISATTTKNNLTPKPVNNDIPLVTPAPKIFMEICDNGIDDDGDGLIDCYDPDCENSTNCDGFFYGSPIPSCNFTATTGNFTISEIWNTRTANGGVANDNNQPGTAPLDQRATVMVGDMDGDGTPEVVAKQDTPGRLYIFDGKTGTAEVNITIDDNNKFSSLAIGDVDNDGLGEVFFFNNSGNLQRYDYANGNLTLTFTSTATSNSLNTPNIADFNHDGVPEVYAGNDIYSSVDGTRLVNGTGSAGDHSTSNNEPFSVAIDVLSDASCTDCSGLELVAGNVVYAVNIQTGTITAAVTAPAGLNDGVTSVADVDNDGDIDGIVVSDGVVYVWDLQTSTQLYSTYNIAGTATGGRANVGNFDSDPELEIGVAGQNRYVVIDPSGSSTSGGTLGTKWEITGLDDGSQRTSSTLFDFEGDGLSEVVYSEEENLVVYNGETGALKTTIVSRSGTRFDNPVVVDVDGDGQSEIICTAQDSNGPSDSQNGYVRAFKSLDLPWRPSRPVWNQHNYFIVNVNDDLTIPRVQQNSLTLPSSFDGKPYKVILNTFLNQASIYDVAGDHIFPAPDISAEINGGAINICQNGTDVSYSFLITNGGSADLPVGTNIAVFSDDPYTSSNPNLLQTLSTPSVIPEGGTLTMAGTITGAPVNMTNIYVLLNHNHATVLSSASLSYPLAANTVVTGTAECSYTDNIATKSVIQSAPPSNTLTVTAGGNIVCPSGSTTITVQSSEVGVTYQLRNGTSNVGASQAGNGGNLTFNTGNLTTETTFNVLASNAGGCSAILTTTQTVKVIDQSLTLQAATGTVCSGEQTEIKLLKSQDGVTYQLRVGASTIGSSATGNGGTISFSTGAITTNPTTFNILASGGACAGVQLTNTVDVATTAAPSAALTVGTDVNTVCNGGTANITVASSESGVNYQLRTGTTKLGVAQAGNGGTLTFQTPAITSSTTFNVLATRNGCTDVQLTQTQTITPTASISTGLTVGSDASTVCTGTGTNITVAGSETGVTYQLRNNTDNSTVGSAVAGTGGSINLPTGNLTATTTFNILASRPGCTDEQLTNTRQITVAQNPTLTLTVGAASSSVCSGTGTNVTVASSETGVTYQLRNNAGNVNIGSAVSGTGGTINLPTGNLTAASTTFNVLATRTSCTPQALNNTVTVTTFATALTTLNVTTDNSTICSGQSANITVESSENGVSYQLVNNGTNTNVGTAVNGNGSNISFSTGTLTATTAFRIEGTKTGCNAVNVGSVQTVNVNPLPGNGLTANIDNSTICNGATVTVTVQSSENGVSYQLHDGSGNTGTAVDGDGGNINLTSGAITSNVTISVIATNKTTNCTNTLTTNFPITVNPLPSNTLSLTPSQSNICSGESVTFTIASSEAGVNYQLFDGTSNVGAPVAGTGGDIMIVASNITNASTTFSVIATNTTTNCQATLTDTELILAGAVPNTGLTVNTSANNVCSGGSVNITVEGSENNVSYTLFDGSSNVGSAQTGNGGTLTFTADNLTTNTTFSIQATNLSSSCTATLATTHNITVTPAPNNGLTVSANTTSICVGGNVTITVAGTENGVNYQLTNGAGNVGSAQAGNGGDLTFALTNLTASSTYRVVATNTTTTCSTTLTQTVDVTVNDFNALIDNGANVNFCGTSGVLTATSVTGASYQWQKDGANIGTNSNQLTVTESGNYIVIITVGGCTKASAASVVTLTTPPVSSVAATSDATNNAVCAGQNITFTATATNGGTNPTYQWRINGNDVAGANQSTFTSNSLTSGDAVSVAMTADLTCATPVTSNDIVVTVNALPTVTFTGVNATVDNNNQVIIDEGSSVTINLTGAASYTWTPTTGISSLSTDGSEAVLAPSSTITYTITATSSEGCVSNGSDTLQVVVRPNTDIFIPSLFSPNGDGKNDRFVVRGTGIQAIDFRVFDRSGNLIYQTTSVDEAMNTGWDGTKNGVNQPIGMYTWSINGVFVDGRKISFNGVSAGKINLLR
ncbi:hypothetical protein BKI52_31005 [marine bacterium AO1-C]|nr:hypothetical protein BKI52_31005 [marine bacterium AO1-C]